MQIKWERDETATQAITRFDYMLIRGGITFNIVNEFRSSVLFLYLEKSFSQNINAIYI